MRSSILLAALLAASSPLLAQDCTRGRSQLSTGTITTSFNGFNGWRTVSPKEFLPGDPARNLVPTNQVVYAIYPDQTAAGESIVCLRSVDGGWSWDPSQAVEVWTETGAGESFDAGEIEVVAAGHIVAVVFTADLDDVNGTPDPNANDRTFLCVSMDQGQTWTRALASSGCNTALSTGDLLLDCDEPVVAIGGDVAGGTPIFHVGFEADYQNAVGVGGASDQEDIYYRRAVMTPSGLAWLDAEEIRIDFAADVTGEVDSDWPGILAEGTFVAIYWQDDRIVSAGGGGGNGAANNTYVRASNSAGADITTVAEHDVTGFTSTIGFSARQSKGILDGQSLYIFCEDSRNLVDDDIYMHRSTDLGVTFQPGVLVSQSPVNIDSDGMVVTGDSGNLAVCYKDDREGPGNVDNDVYVVVSNDGGATWQPEQQILDTVDSDIALYEGAARGDVLAFAHETSAFPEDSAVFWTADAGATWNRCDLSSAMSADTDDLDIAVTGNGDIVAIWQDDQNQGNGANNVFASGVKAQQLEVSSAASPFFRLSGARSSVLAVLLPSLQAPSSRGFGFDPLSGPFLNFTPDGATASAPGIGAFFVPVDARGNATWPIPNFAAFIGRSIYWTTLTADTTSVTGDFPDTVEQR